MSSAIIFKQSYKPRTMESATGLNVRHLNYMATRPGAVYNQNCGFSLWGQLPGDSGIRIQTDLEQAKVAVRDASVNHTLYRAILSVGKADAEQYGLYDRTKWEQLINDHIGSIAREMGIKSQDFCWCAAMHYSKGHPHTHILYWDNSTNPKQDYIPKDEFKRRAERIRAEFSGAIHREEILDLQKEQREPIADLRIKIRAMCREANPERGINLTRLVTDGSLDPIADQLQELLQKMPAKGSLRYGYLPPDYKILVDALVDRCLDIPELHADLQRYENLTQEISRLYGNGEDSTEATLQKATGKLKRELANEVMKTLRDLRTEYLSASPAEQTPHDVVIREAVKTIPPTMESYNVLKGLMPAERIPSGKMAEQIPGYADQLNTVVREMLADARLRLPLQRNALDRAGIHLEEKKSAPRMAAVKNRPSQQPSAPQISNMECNLPSARPSSPEATSASVEKTAPLSENEEEKRYSLFGKEVTREEWTDYQQAYRESARELQKEVARQLREDAGWNRESMSTGSAALICSFARLLSQAANQQQAAAVQTRNNLKNRSKDRSREAKKDYHATQNLAGDWEYS